MDSIFINYLELVAGESYGTMKSEQKLVSFGHKAFLRLWEGQENERY